ncbi:MAG: hypothetical protein Q7J57_10935 [Gemmobacter sp.]|nr:hypothetical protein [Gemmobacter sp.]
MDHKAAAQTRAANDGDALREGAMVARVLGNNAVLRDLARAFM